MRLDIHPWSNTLRLAPYIEYLESEKCKSKEYVIFVDTDDVFISESPDKILKMFLDKFNCDLLFNATSWAKGYYNTAHSKRNKNWVKKTYKGWYLNAGAYIGKKDMIISVYKEVLKYVTDKDLPAKKWYLLESNESKTFYEMEKNFPNGCGSDQAILRHIQPNFYPNLQIDHKKEIFSRIGAVNISGGRNIFIDCGGHEGQSIRKFKTSLKYRKKNFEIFSFEPNFDLIKDYAMDNPKDKIMNLAVWIEDKKMNFYLDRNDGDGSSLSPEKKHPSGVQENDLDNPLMVDAIDFSSWVLRNFNKRDYIILKMDIEGAEYGVLPKMIEDGSLKYIDEIYIEWHYKKVNVSEKQHQVLENSIKNICPKVHGEYLKGAEHLQYS